MHMLNQSRIMTSVSCSATSSSKQIFVKYNKPDSVVIDKQSKELIIFDEAPIET